MTNCKRLIDANGSYTLNATDNTGHSLCFGGGIISVMDIRGRCVCEFFSDDAPTVDAVEVVHGQWEFSHTTTVEKFNVVKCSNCGHEAFAIAIYVKQGRYCPNCGAKMDDERRGE